MSRPRQALVCFIVLAAVASLAPIGVATAADRTNVPLKNWGGFSEFRDAVYDDLERLVTAGLADRVLLNTRPLSRVEAARIVARAIEKIRNDDAGGLNARRDLEPVLDRLMEELNVELTSLGVRTSEGGTAPGFFAFTPIDRAQAFGAYANHQFSLVNSQGRTFKRGVNGGLTFESRAQLGDFLSLYLQPELLENEDYGAARLATGYAKLTLFNVELLVGRDSLAWGPGYHNGLLLTNNAAPLDQIRIGAAEPFLLPWVGQWVGPMKVLMFLAQLEERRDHAYTKLTGMRLTFAPATCSRRASSPGGAPRAASEASTCSSSSARTGSTPGSSTRGPLRSRSITTSSRAATGRAGTSSRTSSARMAGTTSPASPLASPRI